MAMRIKWFAVLFLEMALAGTGSRGLDTDSIPRQKSLEVERNDNLNNSYAVKTIQSEDGDIIECIDIFKQPALNHPAVRNHKIQLAPSYDPTMGTTTKTETPQQRKGYFPTMKTTQLWQRSGSCPDGTVPIRKMQKKTQHKALPIDYYARKKPKFFHHDTQSEDEKDINLLHPGFSSSIVHTEGYAYYGAKGDITVWNPNVEGDDEYSTSQVALASGPRNKYEEIEFGWAVNPHVYGDRQTRLFVHWTVDGSNKTGCFDHTCPGFVQTSKEVALGAAIFPGRPGLPFVLSLFIYKDPKTDNWWVQYQGGINVGYWPAELFSLIRFHAETVQWGGEVYSTRVGTHPHTTTGMGSGGFADFRFGNSGSVTRMQVLQSGGLLKPNYLSPFSDEYDCYNFHLIKEFVKDPQFYYGGPGRNEKCP